MQTALYTAQIIVSVVLIILVVIQSHTGMQDTGSISTTRRGLEKTLHDTTIATSAIFLFLALVNSLPLLD